MLQLLGACLILLGSVGSAYVYMDKEKRKIFLLENWEKILEMFQSEISYKKQPLLYAVEEIAEKIQGQEGKYLEKIRKQMLETQGESFSEIWLKECKNYVKQEKLTIEEKRLIEELGLMTGFEDEKIQVKFMEEQKRKWQTLRVRKQKEHQEREKLVWTLSISMGAILILILW